MFFHGVVRSVIFIICSRDRRTDVIKDCSASLAGTTFRSELSIIALRTSVPLP